MPKYEIDRKPTFAKAVDQIRATLLDRGITQMTASNETGIPQGNISKLLSGKVKKENEDFIQLCKYAGIKYPPKIRNPLEDPRIQQAVDKVFDGTDESIILIARLIECASVLNSAKSRRASK